MRIASYALWVAAPLSLASFALLGAACSSSENTTPVATEAGADAAKTGDGGAKETSVDQPDTGPACKLDKPLGAKAACNTCAEASCCAEANGCTDDEDCGAFVACAAACLSDAGVPLDGGASTVDAGSAQGCLAACQKAHKGGAQLYQALVQCVQGSCKSDCL